MLINTLLGVKKQRPGTILIFDVRMIELLLLVDAQQKIHHFHLFWL